ncbi:hypothetical protein J2T41_001972 [Pseudomonas citronellolis]|uniref:hypothetical protein n=1 Tax=Pseudomonas citronellolis TaxID=53408 RepID=UPI00209D25E6|nr:hypothetical protein [Pseudomonas citronellolis]MCP1642367.1 hypothetical protein [Pseudomonas citronellolis]MCP1665522.1 hypothetical protein [Pseudomonas citronellolis]MCP1696200.1 hypothetical protein [Pseudomonas citronellolis]MCP1703059.1 hypothetical protein [Pseudomonas citronellolis]MCP1796980.1 hypothetical protein [Pseudomonas citronellolis]
MAGQVVRLTREGLGSHLSEGKGWSEGYVVIVNLTVIHQVFETEEEAKAFAATIPEGWEPSPPGVWAKAISSPE